MSSPELPVAPGTPSRRRGGAFAPVPRCTVASFGYHDVADEPGGTGFQRSGALPYRRTVAAFARDLDAIAAGGCVPELVTDLEIDRPARHVLLTFDDGGRSAVHIGDELAARGWKGHFFIVTSLIGRRTFLDSSEIRYLRSCGHLIGSHSHTHPDIFNALPRARMLDEWRVSRDVLAELLDEPCVAASVPGGDISPLVLESAGAVGLQYLFTSEPWVLPRHVGGCWILGRFIPKAWTRSARIGALARLQGWRRALLVRRAKVFARAALPSVYRYYVAHITRECDQAEADGSTL